MLRHLEYTFLMYNPNSGKWELFRNPYAINIHMYLFDALQPGVLSLTMVTQNYQIIVINLQDCSTIPLFLGDKCMPFQYLLLSNQALIPHFQWKILPQVLVNSPTFWECLEIYPIRQNFPHPRHQNAFV